MAATNRYNEMVLTANYLRWGGYFEPATAPALRAAKEMRAASMNRPIFSIVLSLAAAVTSGAVFLDSLIRQFALVEVAASLLTALQVFFLSSAIADMVERRKKASGSRNSWVIVFTVLLLAFYSFTRYSR